MNEPTTPLWPENDRPPNGMSTCSCGHDGWRAHKRAVEHDFASDQLVLLLERATKHLSKLDADLGSEDAVTTLRRSIPSLLEEARENMRFTRD